MKINWTSKTAIILLLALAAILGQQKFRQYRLQKAIEAEKGNLERQLGELEGKNKELNATLSYLNSKTYKELVARQQLNMQKEGEFVYNFAENPTTTSSESGEGADNSGNFQKWVNFFLNKP